jgi:hypothetical protein
MIKRILIIAIASAALLMGTTMYAQKPEKKEPREPKLLKEKKFDKKIKKWAGNVVVTEDNIVFLDKDGNVKKTKKIPEQTAVHLSKRGKKIGQATYYGVTEKGASSMKFKMMDEEGNVLWETDKLFGSERILDAEGDVVVELECSEGGCGRAVIFHDRQNPVGMNVIPDVNEESEIAGGYPSEDGNYLVVRYMTRQKPDELVLFDVLEKKPLWIKQFESRTIRDIGVSAKGNYVIVRTYISASKESFIYIFDKYSRLILTHKPDHIGNFSFDSDNDEKHIVAASNSGELYLFDMDLKKLLWKYFTGDKNIGFINVDISSGFIASSVTTINPKDSWDGSLPRYLYVFDYTGHLILSRKFTGHGLDRWSEGLKVILDNSGGKIRITLKNKLYEFENEFAK